MIDRAADDTEMLRRYAEERSEAAFAELVRRHLNLVYGCALRRVGGDAHLAEDVVQQVFSVLARDAAALSRHAVLGGWLFTTTRFVAAQAVRAERRRHAREQEAHTMNELSAEQAVLHDWERLRPVLDDTIAELGQGDREAVVLRFFEGRSFADVGARLRLTENAARMRVDRALDKLHALLARRGVNSTAAALGVALSGHTAAAAPAGLVASVTTAALASGAAAKAGAATAFFMSMTKLQFGVAGALAVVGATGYLVQADTTARLRDEAASLRLENAASAPLQAENLRLARTAAEVADMRNDDAAFRRLQDEAAVLRSRLQQIARAEEARAATAQQNAGLVYDISKLDQLPRAKFQARPQYPLELRNSGVGGEVIVDFLVDKKGEVQNGYALRSSQPEFAAAAVEAVSKWKFDPGRKGGRDVVTHMQVPIVFTEKGDSNAGGITVVETAMNAGNTPPPAR